MLQCDNPLTYCRLSADDEVLEVIPLVGSWYAKTISGFTDKTLSLVQAIQTRIPLDQELPEGFVPHTGDLLINSHPVLEQPTVSELKHKYHAATIQAAHDNRRSPISPHWKLEAV